MKFEVILTVPQVESFLLLQRVCSDSYPLSQGLFAHTGPTRNSAHPPLQKKRLGNAVRTLLLYIFIYLFI